MIQENQNSENPTEKRKRVRTVVKIKGHSYVKVTQQNSNNKK